MSNKFAGGFSALLAQEAKQKARQEAEKASAPKAQNAPEALSAPQAQKAPEAPGAVQTRSAHQAQNAPKAQSASGITEAVPQAQGALEAQSAQQAPPVAGLDVVPEAGFLQLSNTLVDGLLPRLDPYAQAIYLRLYRLTYGHHRETCVISWDTLAVRANVSRRQAIRSVEKLESLGLVERVPVAGKARNNGTHFRVTEIGRAGQALRASEAPHAPGAHMKDNLKNKHETAPVAVAPAPDVLSVYDVRRIAARFRELHHGEADYTRERLRRDVCTALVGEGREVDDRLVDEAIGT
jgi:hypothetical protein